MTPAQLNITKYNLDKAYLLLKPKQAAIAAFTAKLVHLLNRISKEENEVNVKIYLEAILKDTYFEVNYQKPENSSPVCFATLSGLREGFEEAIIIEQQTPTDINNTAKTGMRHFTKRTAGAEIKDAVCLTKSGFLEIIKHFRNSQTLDKTALESQIDELVYQLFELSPEEIAIVEGS